MQSRARFSARELLYCVIADGAAARLYLTCGDLIAVSDLRIDTMVGAIACAGRPGRRAGARPGLRHCQQRPR